MEKLLDVELDAEADEYDTFGGLVFGTLGRVLADGETVSLTMQGLAVDVLNVATAEKKALDWLGKHCWEYGFILRYPPEKTQITKIIYEPWHFRYVGVEISMDMKDTGLCLEEYLQADKAAASDEEAQAA